MDENENIFSLRIFSVDHYINTPISGIDTCYSDFRAYTIKQVPIIRIFGIKKDGIKVCMHVHGVFPYLYVPFNQSNEVTADHFTYQVAASLDKAINISLGQSTSSTQHVYKVVLVKAIPFYGYHPGEHQFLKIYLYNPYFIKRAANLFQNGAILNQVLQPHESHVPFILQFFIDYNLYGMSFLHVPSNVVRYRLGTKEEMFGINSAQCLPDHVVRISTSKLEIDISAAHILNRLHINDPTSSSQHANPGIAFLWNDERIRRGKMKGNIPELEIPISQERCHAQPTESDIFHREALQRKLQLLSSMNDTTQMNSTINSTINTNENNNRFNLKQFLLNSVYPAECTPGYSENIANASYIEDHSNRRKLMPTKLKESASLDESIVDENLILNLSQRPSLNESLTSQEYDLLEIMKQLDSHENLVDNDSVLAPLTQPENALSQPVGSLISSGSHTNPETNQDLRTADTVLNEDLFDSDDDLLNDFTICLEEPKDQKGGEDSPIKQENYQIPQLDGMDEETSKNSLKNGVNSSRLVSDKDSPLDTAIVKSPNTDENIVEFLRNNREISIELRSGVSLPKKVKTNKSLDKPTLIDLTTDSDEEISKSEENTLKENEISINPNEKELLKNGDTNQKCDNTVPEKINQSEVSAQSSINSNININETTQSPSNIRVNYNPVVKLKKIKFPKTVALKKRYSLRSRKKPASKTNETDTEAQCSKDDEKLNFGKNKSSSLKSCREWSNCEVAREYDRQNDFYPEPGPSHYNFYALLDIPSHRYYPKNEDDQWDLKCADSSANAADKSSDNLSDESSIDMDMEEDNPLSTKSFYDTSFAICESPSPSKSNLLELNNLNLANDSPANDIKLSTPVVQKLRNKFNVNSECPKESCAQNQNIVLTSRSLPPTRKDVLDSIQDYGIPQVVAAEPFYSNADDQTAKKEVGHTVLQIQRKDDYEVHQSSLTEDGLYSWRRKCFTELTGQAANTIEEKKIREVLASQKEVAIYPNAKPPTYDDATLWLVQRNPQDDNLIVAVYDEDSPIKVRQEKAKLNLETNDQNESDCDISISLTPPLRMSEIQRKFTESSTKCLQDRNVTIRKVSVPKVKQSLNPVFEKIKQHSTTKRTESPNLFSEIDGKGSDEVICLDDDDEDFEIIPSSPISNGYSHKKSIRNTAKATVAHKKSDAIEVVKQNQLERTSFVNNFHLDGSNYESNNSFGLTGVTLENTFGFKMDLDNFHSAKTTIEYNYLTIMSLEVHVQTRGNLNPDPIYDPISAIFYSIKRDAPDDHYNDNNQNSSSVTGILMLDPATKSQTNPILNNENGRKIKFLRLQSEEELLIELLRLISVWDPDIYMGYEIEMLSWGYVIQRGNAIEFNLPPLLSRVPSNHTKPFVEDEREFDGDQEPGNRICGRVYLDVWRLMRSEIALTSYTFENVMYHILHRRYPQHSFRHRTQLWSNLVTRWIVLEYFLERTNGTIELLNQLDIIGRTAELAKLFGIQFYEVLSRGSQFRVESMMLRIAKPRNIVPVSPSVPQRAHMRAPEYLPLILEPLSRMYTDPLIVLDFQSLYPSMMIGYNYCFSTCLGRVQNLGESEPFEFGASHLRVSPKLLKKLLAEDLVTVSPCGAVFVKASVREGVLPRMVREILDTRLMVKQSMKLHKNDKLLQRVLHSRQLGLKLMANVTYGYTAANFSGRMPCVEVGDSVVSKGRETLERAIKMVESNQSWGCKVVYGDTDSLFVLVPGRSRQDAFKIGEEIVIAVTEDNPHPVKLKLEKIYQPCILQTKKRYVGFMYESADQQTPAYEAKGIETVRRDGCPAVAKMLEKSLKILFETYDVSAIKRYVCRQFTKILTGRANVQDLIFAKEFRGINGYKPGACVPALELTKKWLQSDRRAEPRRGERVPYLVVNGAPGVPLIRLVRSPHEYLHDDGLKINAFYYITKVIIPPLNRCLLLIGADVAQWYADLPRKVQALSVKSNIFNRLTHNTKKSTISQYFSTTNCAIDCGEQTQLGICSNCLKKPTQSAIILSSKIAMLDRKYSLITKICQSCCGRQFETNCQSLDCPVLFVKNVRERDHSQIDHLRELLNVHLS